MEPSTRQYKNVLSPNIKIDTLFTCKVSVGFGYDPVGNDYKIMRIVSFGNGMPNSCKTQVEVYSMSRNCWREIVTDKPLCVCRPKFEVVVKGMPYWTVVLEEGMKFVPSFDVYKEVFGLILMPNIPLEILGLVNYKESLAMIAHSGPEGLNNCFELWLMDECSGESSWTKKFCVELINSGVQRLFGCSKNGEIMTRNGVEGVLLLSDPQTNETRKVVIEEAKNYPFQVFNYTESLVPMEGSRQVVKAEKDATKGGRNKVLHTIARSIKIGDSTAEFSSHQRLYFCLVCGLSIAIITLA